MSPYYSPEPDVTVPYWCPNCDKWYAVFGSVQVSCNVIHGPGSCCHAGETEMVVRRKNVPTQVDGNDYIVTSVVS